MAKSNALKTSTPRAARARTAPRASTSAHLICRGSNGIVAVEGKANHFVSGTWDINVASAERLVGGMIYFHEAKAAPAYFGGRVISFESVKADNPHSKRVTFLIEADPHARGVAWEGRKDIMAWFSGVVEH